MTKPLILASLALCISALAATEKPLPRATPESQGVSSVALLDFVRATDTVDAMHSLMVVRHGHVIAEGWWAPYDAQSTHELYSLSKSFTSTAVGMAVAEGKLGVFDEVLKFFPDDAPANPGGNLKAMRVRDLLSMSTGHQDEPPVSPDRVSAASFLAQPVPHKPGSHFKYNTPATFMQSAIVQKVTGQTVFDYLTPRLFEPLGIHGATWATNYQGISLGGYGLKVRTEDIAKFGQLYLQKGRWNGKQLIPAGWVADASAKQASNGSNPTSDWDQGYGYQFWRCRNGAFRGDGAFGQYCVVLPEQDAVVAITSGVKDMQAVLNLVWDKLLPAMESKKLKADKSNAKTLQETLAHLEVRRPSGSTTSSASGKIIGRTYTFPANDQGLDSLSIVSGGGDSLTLVLNKSGVETRFPCGLTKWAPGRGDFGSGLMGPYHDVPVAASAAWTSDDTLVIKVCATETPFYATHTLRFDGDRVTRDWELNVGFGKTKQPQLVGTAK